MEDSIRRIWRFNVSREPAQNPAPHWSTTAFSTGQAIIGTIGLVVIVGGIVVGMVQHQTHQDDAIAALQLKDAQRDVVDRAIQDKLSSLHDDSVKATQAVNSLYQILKEPREGQK